MTTPDDELYVDMLVDELRHEMRKRGCHESLKFLDREDAIDGGVDFMLAVSVADGLNIPIPDHFDKDAQTLEHLGDISPGCLDDLREVMASQRARGLSAN